MYTRFQKVKPPSLCDQRYLLGNAYFPVARLRSPNRHRNRRDSSRDCVSVSVPTMDKESDLVWRKQADDYKSNRNCHNPYRIWLTFRVDLGRCLHYRVRRVAARIVWPRASVYFACRENVLEWMLSRDRWCIERNRMHRLLSRKNNVREFSPGWIGLIHRVDTSLAKARDLVDQQLMNKLCRPSAFPRG